jgi:hypothetical protein
MFCGRGGRLGRGADDMARGPLSVTRLHQGTRLVDSRLRVLADLVHGHPPPTVPRLDVGAGSFTAVNARDREAVASTDALREEIVQRIVG